MFLIFQEIKKWLFRRIQRNIEKERGQRESFVFNSKREEEKGKGLTIILQNGASRILQIGPPLVI